MPSRRNASAKRYSKLGVSTQFDNHPHKHYYREDPFYVETLVIGTPAMMARIDRIRHAAWKHSNRWSPAPLAEIVEMDLLNQAFDLPSRFPEGTVSPSLCAFLWENSL